MSSTTLSIEGLLRNLLLSGSTGSNRVSVSDVISRMIDGNTLSIRHYTKNVACRILRNELRGGVNVENARRVLTALLRHYPSDAELVGLLDSFGGDCGRHSVFTHTPEDWSSFPSPSPSLYQRLTTPVPRRSALESYKMSTNLRLPAAFSADSILRDLSSSSDEAEQPDWRPKPDHRMHVDLARLTKPDARVHVDLHRLERILDLKKHRDLELSARSCLRVWRDLMVRSRIRSVQSFRFVQKLQDRVSTQMRRTLYLLYASSRVNLLVAFSRDASRLGFVLEKMVARRQRFLFSILSNLGHMQSSVLLANQQEEVWAVRSLLTSKVLRIAHTRLEEKRNLFAKKCFTNWSKFVKARNSKIRPFVSWVDNRRKFILRNTMTHLFRHSSKRDQKVAGIQRLISALQASLRKRLFSPFWRQLNGLDKKQLSSLALAKIVCDHCCRMKRWGFQELVRSRESPVDVLNEKISKLNLEKALHFFAKKNISLWRSRIRVRRVFARMANWLSRRRRETLLHTFRILANLRVRAALQKLAVQQITRVFFSRMNFAIKQFSTVFSKKTNFSHALLRLNKIVCRRLFSAMRNIYAAPRPENGIPQITRCFSSWKRRVFLRKKFIRFASSSSFPKSFAPLVRFAKQWRGIFEGKELLIKFCLKSGMRSLKRQKKIRENHHFFAQNLLCTLEGAKLRIYFGVLSTFKTIGLERILLTMDRKYRSAVSDRERAAREVESAATELHDEYRQLHGRNEELENELVVVQAHYERAARDSENLLFKLGACTKYEGRVGELESENNRLKHECKVDREKLIAQSKELANLNEKLTEWQNLNSSVSFYKSKCLLQAEQIGSLQHVLRKSQQSPRSVSSPRRYSIHADETAYRSYGGTTHSTQPIYATQAGNSSLQNLKRAVDRSASMSRMRSDRL